MITFDGHFLVPEVFFQGLYLQKKLIFLLKLWNTRRQNEAKVLEKIKQELESGEYLAVWINPFFKKRLKK